MQYTRYFPLTAFFATLILLSCKNDPPATIPEAPSGPEPVQVKPVPTEGAVTYAITEGTVYWAGKKSLGAMHSGTINVESGALLVNQGQLLSGNVVLDMQSIAVSDLQDAGEKRDLESHLKDKDFFEVKKFPKAEFKFTEVLPSTHPAFNAVIAGELIMKGKSNPINIPVKLRIEGDDLVAESTTFPINRTQWGVNFRSGVLGTVKDKLIEDVVPLSLKLKAKKAAWGK